MSGNNTSSGYHGGIVSETPSINLQKCSQPYIDMDLSLYKQASLHNDPATANLRNQQSIGVGAYHLDNMYGCDCGLEAAREVLISQPAISFNAGSGWMGEDGCKIDNDSSLRFQDQTNKRFIQQLPNRYNSGFFGKGSYDVDNETLLKDSSQTSVDKPCNVYSGVTLINQYTPMIPSLAETVQNRKHIIQEDNDQSWVRGGIPTREMVRNMDYIKNCNLNN